MPGFLLIRVAIATLARWLEPWRSLGVGKLQANRCRRSAALPSFRLPACDRGQCPVARRLLASGAARARALGFLFAGSGASNRCAGQHLGRRLTRISPGCCWPGPWAPWVVAGGEAATLPGQRSEAARTEQVPHIPSWSCWKNVV